MLGETSMCTFCATEITSLPFYMLRIFQTRKQRCIYSNHLTTLFHDSAKVQTTGKITNYRGNQTSQQTVKFQMQQCSIIAEFEGSTVLRHQVHRCPTWQLRNRHPRCPTNNNRMLLNNSLRIVQTTKHVHQQLAASYTLAILISNSIEVLNIKIIP